MNPDREMNLEPQSGGRVVEIWSMLLRHIFLIVFATSVGVALGYLSFLKTPPVFQSSVSLLVRRDSINKSIPFQGTDALAPTQNHAVLIATPLVIERSLDKPIGSPTIGTAAERRLRDLACFKGIDNPAGYILRRISAKPSGQNNAETSDIVNISFRDSDAMTCKYVLEAVVSSYQDFLGETHRNVSQEVLDLIEQARSTLMTHLQEVEAEYTQFCQDTPLIFGTESRAKNIHKDRLTEIEAARGKLIITLTERRAELQAITDSIARGASREALTLMLQSTKRDEGRAIGNEKGGPTNEIFQLMLEEQLLLIDLGPDHPRVKALQKKIALTQDHYLNEAPDDERPKRSKRGDFLNVCIDSIRHEVFALESKIIELDELFQSERHASKAISVYEVKNEYFQKELLRTEALYQGVLKRLDELNLMQDYGGYKTSVISPAGVGVYVAPNFNQSLLMGGIIGCAIGILLSYLAEVNDGSFRTVHEASECLGLPIVGQIPVIRQEKSSVPVNSELDKTLVTHFKPKSRLSEAYRAIRTSLYFSTRGEKHKAIQVTSPNPGDGKSTLSGNLAISIAHSGKRVVLIDADFRRPRIHDMFAVDNSIGMSSVISGDAELPDAIQPTEIKNLWILPCGPTPDNPCELLTSIRFEELLQVLKEQYDFVIVDSPPVLAVTDPSAVAARVDGVILTLRLSKRARGDSLRATEQLAAVGANTIGIIVNGVQESRGYGYGGYYSRYGNPYNYGTEEENPYYQNPQIPVRREQELQNRVSSR